MPKYKIRTRFIFDGEFYVESENKDEAQEIVRAHCGLVLGGEIQVVDDSIKDWAFGVHPEKRILSIARC